MAAIASWPKMNMRCFPSLGVAYQFDETEYLLKSEVNKERLLSAIENVTQRQNLVDVFTMTITQEVGVAELRCEYAII